MGKGKATRKGGGRGVDLYDPLCCWWWPTWRQRNLRKPISTLRFAAYERRRCRRRAVAPLLPLGWHVRAFLLSLFLSLSLSCSLWWSLCDDCVGVPGGVWRGVQCGAKLDCVYKSNCIVLVAVAVVAVVAVVVVAWTLLFTQITSCCQLQQQQQQGQPLCRQALAKFCCTQLTHAYTRLTLALTHMYVHTQCESDIKRRH